MSHQTPRFAFFTERQVGIGSAAQAIEPYVRAAGHHWTDVSYAKEGGWIERLQFLPARPRGTLRGYLQVRAGLRQGPFDAVLFLTHNPAVFHQDLLKSVPTVLWTDVTPIQLDQQAEHYGHTVTESSRLSSFKHNLVKQTYHRAARVVGWSNWARGSFVRDYGVAEDKTAVVHPGIDLARFQPGSGPKPPGLPRLLFVGGDFERKGGSLLLEVFRSRFQGRALLDIVTRDPVPPADGVTVHHGLTAGSEPLLRLYRDASAFVLPTQGDCFSIASMEAMAMGLPVVVCNVGGIADIVEQGQSGYLTKVRDGASLGDALDSLLGDPARCTQFGTRGRNIVLAKFNAEQTARSLLDQLTRASSAAR